MRQLIVVLALAISLAACGPSLPEGPIGDYLKAQHAAIEHASDLLEAANDEASAQDAANALAAAFITQLPNKAEWRKLSQSDRAMIEAYRRDALTPAVMRLMTGMYRITSRYPQAAKRLEQQFRARNAAAAARLRAQLADGAN